MSTQEAIVFSSSGDIQCDSCIIAKQNSQAQHLCASCSVYLQKKKYTETKACLDEIAEIKKENIEANQRQDDVDYSDEYYSGDW